MFSKTFIGWVLFSLISLNLALDSPNSEEMDGRRMGRDNERRSPACVMGLRYRTRKCRYGKRNKFFGKMVRRVICLVQTLVLLVPGKTNTLNSNLACCHVDLACCHVDLACSNYYPFVSEQHFFIVAENRKIFSLFKNVASEMVLATSQHLLYDL